MRRLEIFSGGFSLMDVMIALAILGILAALAYPRYTEVMQRTRRLDAMNALLRVQAAQGRYRSGHVAYAERLSQLGWADDEAISAQGYYRFRLLRGDAGGYVALAQPLAEGAQAGDRCRLFVLDQDGPDPARSSHEDCWAR